MGVRNARTWLFVPGDRPDRLAKAAASGADEVIVDLEDAVAAPNKSLAREAVVHALDSGAELVVRINPPRSREGTADLAAVTLAHRSPRVVVVAKAEKGDDLAAVTEQVEAPLVALVESARGLMAAAELATVPALVRFAFGAVDYSLDIGSSTDDDVLAFARSHLVNVSREADLGAPLDTPSLDIRDVDAVIRSSCTARRFGMGGKLCIHPVQVAHVSAAFAPSAEEVRRARELLAADEGAATFDGRMIDRPVLERARKILTSAGEEA